MSNQKCTLILNNFDGSLPNIKISPKAHKSKVSFKIFYYEHENGKEKYVKAKFVFKNVISMNFEVNLFENPIGCELCGLYEMFDKNKKVEMIEKVFNDRLDAFLYPQNYDYDANDDNDCLNYRPNIERVIAKIDKYRLFMQHTQGGVYYILASKFKIIKG